MPPRFTQLFRPSQRLIYAPVWTECCHMDQQPTKTPQRLDEISTEWTIVKDPAQFVLRYGRAMQLYLVVLLKNRHDAEDVAQEFFLRITRAGFMHARRDRGRFRDYLK